jgi:subtilisin family serine protease
LVGIFCVGQLADAAPPEGHDFTVVAADAVYKPGELLVRFAPKADGKQLSTAEKKQILISLGGAALKHNFKIVPGLSLVKLPAEQTVKDALKTFNNRDGILYAEPNYRIYFASTFPDDPNFSEQWGLHNTGQTGGTEDADIDAPEAWDIATEANDVIVAVIDMGVDYNHPDLTSNIWINESEYNGEPNVDDDNNGYIDDIRGWDFSDDNDSDPMDYMYHGTHCAGIIGAVGDNNQGISGVCWNVKIMPLALVPQDYGEPNGEQYDWGTWVSRAIKAIDYAVDNGARVLNNSWGDDFYIQSLKDTIEDVREEGVLFVAAAMNLLPHTPYPDNDAHPVYPASYDLDNIIVVLATNKHDTIWSGSHYGKTSVDLGAPGDEILSTMPTFETFWMNLNNWSTYYEMMSGTSMAAPHVAGAAALIWSANPYLSYLEVKDILLDTVDHLDDLEGKCVTEGRLNLYKALHKAALYPGPGGFCIKSDSGEPVARFDNFGNLFLKGNLEQGNENPPSETYNDGFKFRNPGDANIAMIDACNGKMYIYGSLLENRSSLNPQGDSNFIIKGSSGNVVAYIDDPNGDIYLKGKLFQNPNP